MYRESGNLSWFHSLISIAVPKSLYTNFLPLMGWLKGVLNENCIRPDGRRFIT